MLTGNLTFDIIFWAYLLDMLMGDPRRLPHPVVLMGKAISYFETVFRKWIKNEQVSGACFALMLITGTWTITHVVISGGGYIHPILGKTIEIILLFFCLSARTLEKAAMDVFDALETHGIIPARKKLAMIVGRQVEYLDEPGVTRAAVETVAENYVDGFLAVLFFALIGGVPGAMAYKMINTLDSMIGYNNDTYRLFGRTAARIDDVANFIPARLSVVFIALSTLMLNPSNALSSLKTAIKQGRFHKSPNSGYPEAAFAGALKVRLGGPNFYHGVRVEKPFIGKEFKDPGRQKIRQACDLMLLASFLAVGISCFILFVFSIH